VVRVSGKEPLGGTKRQGGNMRIADIRRPPKKLIQALKNNVSGATAATELSRLGIRDPYMQGPVSHTPGMKIGGPAVTLQFMPKREDLYGESEYADPEKQLHRHALYHACAGDVVVVDARGDMRSGVFGKLSSRPISIPAAVR